MSIWISDLHMGAGGSSDEFLNGGKTEEMFRLFADQPDHSIRVVGDLLALNENMLADIQAYWKDKFDLVFLKLKDWIVGNHDIRALGFIDGKFRGVQTKEVVIEDGTVFAHGHRLDSLQDMNKVKETVTIISQWIVENTSPEVGEYARDLEAILRGGREGEKEVYADRAFDYYGNYWDNGSRVTKIVMGHTHQKDYQTRNGITLLNLGCGFKGDYYDGGTQRVL